MCRTDTLSQRQEVQWKPKRYCRDGEGSGRIPVNHRSSSWSHRKPPGGGSGSVTAGRQYLFISKPTSFLYRPIDHSTQHATLQAGRTRSFVLALVDKREATTSME